MGTEDPLVRTAAKRKRSEEAIRTPAQITREHADALSGKRTAVSKVHMADLASAMVPDSPYSQAILDNGFLGPEAGDHIKMLETREEPPRARHPGPVASSSLRCCDETGVTALGKVGGRPLRTGVPDLDSLLGAGLSYPAMLEITGASASGKTELMLTMCGECTLPDIFEGVHVGGNEASVLYLCLGSAPTDNITRLVTIYDSHARRALASAGRKQDSEGEDEDWVAAFVRDCLARVHFLECATSLELMAAALSIGRFQQSCPGLRAIVIDSISMVQWFDRAERACGDANRPLMESVFAALQRACSKHSLVLFVTRWGSAKRRDDATSGSHGGGGSGASGGSEPIARRWAEMVTAHISLEARTCPVGRRPERPEYHGQVKVRRAGGRTWDAPRAVCMKAAA